MPRDLPKASIYGLLKRAARDGHVRSTRNVRKLKLRGSSRGKYNTAALAKEHH